MDSGMDMVMDIDIGMCGNGHGLGHRGHTDMERDMVVDMQHKH
jgi:hypothetical protein